MFDAFASYWHFEWSYGAINEEIHDIRNIFRLPIFNPDYSVVNWIFTPFVADGYSYWTDISAIPDFVGPRRQCTFFPGAIAFFETTSIKEEQYYNMK